MKRKQIGIVDFKANVVDNDPHTVWKMKAEAMN